MIRPWELGIYEARMGLRLIIHVIAFCRSLSVPSYLVRVMFFHVVWCCCMLAIVIADHRFRSNMRAGIHSYKAQLQQLLHKIIIDYHNQSM